MRPSRGMGAVRKGKLPVAMKKAPTPRTLQPPRVKSLPKLT